MRWRPGPSATALALGALGGGLFFLAQAPLAWLLGAMAATTVGAVAGLPVAVPPVLRSVMIAVLGVLLGAAFTPELVARAGAFGLAILCLAGVLALMAAAGYLVLRRLAGFDVVSAYFGGMPGGLSEMVLVGESLGADVQRLSLVHATRIILVVLAIPLYFKLVEGVAVPPLPLQATQLWDLGLLDALVLLSAAGLGVPLATLARVPAAVLTGPMLLSALVHLVGLSTAAPPVEIVAVAQVVIGCAIGTRFVGLSAAAARAAVAASLGSSVAMLAIAVAAAVALAPVIGVPGAALFLAFAPGGLTEMALIALSLHYETAFVSTLHIARITLVVIAAPLLFQALRARLP